MYGVSLVGIASLLAPSLVAANEFAFMPSGSYGELTRALYRRDVTAICSNNGTFAAGSNTDLTTAPALQVRDDAYLQAFVSPRNGNLCTLSILIKKPSAETVATLRLYDDTSPQISIVNGTAKEIAAALGR